LIHADSVEGRVVGRYVLPHSDRFAEQLFTLLATASL
jgi:hypothetical protein